MPSAAAATAVRFEPEAGEHVGRARERRRAELQQVVRAGGERARDLARNGEHLSPLLQREIGGDQRAAALARLDHHDRGGEAGDDPVARREAPRSGLDARCVLGDDEAALGDSPRELGVRGRIVAVDAAAEHRHRDPAGLERTPVRLGVDAAREAADDHQPGGGELPPERSRDRGAVARAGARADDRHRRPRERLGRRGAAQEQPGRRIVDRAQERREVRTEARDEAEAACVEPPLVRLRVERAHVRSPARARRLAYEMRAGLRGEHCEGELVHVPSSCGAR